MQQISYWKYKLEILGFQLKSSQPVHSQQNLRNTSAYKSQNVICKDGLILCSWLNNSDKKNCYARNKISFIKFRSSFIHVFHVLRTNIQVKAHVSLLLSHFYFSPISKLAHMKGIEDNSFFFFFNSADSTLEKKINTPHLPLERSKKNNNKKIKLGMGPGCKWPLFFLLVHSESVPWLTPAYLWYSV